MAGNEVVAMLAVCEAFSDTVQREEILGFHWRRRIGPVARTSGGR